MPLFCPKCHSQLTIPTNFDGKGLSCGMCFWLGDAADALKELPAAMKMPYVLIDIETTGINPDVCQILEIGAIYDDGTKPIDTLPIFHRYVCHNTYIGEPRKPRPMV